MYALTKPQNVGCNQIEGNNLNVVRMMISVFDTIKNVVRKGENVGYQHVIYI